MFEAELAPGYGVIEALWERNEVQTALTSNDGESDVLEIGDPFWSLDVRVALVSRDHFDEWDSFLARRNLSENSFTMWRSFRIRPRDALIASDASLLLAGIDVANSQISFAGWGNGRQAHYGDMVAYRTEANGYWVGQVTAPQTADGSGNIAVSVWPRPWAPHASAPAPKRFKALGEFRLLKKPRLKEGHKEWEVRFTAEQVLA